VSSRVEWAASPRASVYATWSFATGPPNPYAVLPGEPSRLDASHHLDLGATVNGTAGPVRWTVRGTLFNAYDHSNPWHRTAIGVLRSDGNDPNRRPDLDYALVDVYDLGVRPSLSLSATW
jgi:hypothetical protein